MTGTRGSLSQGHRWHLDLRWQCMEEEALLQETRKSQLKNQRILKHFQQMLSLAVTASKKTKIHTPSKVSVYTKHRTNLSLLAPSPQLLCTQTSSTVVGKANQQHEHTVNHPRNVDPTKLIYVTLFSYQFFAVFRECTEEKTLKTPKPTTD